MVRILQGVLLFVKQAQRSCKSVKLPLVVRHGHQINERRKTSLVYRGVIFGVHELIR